jgi:hemin uptake protein HemP
LFANTHINAIPDADEPSLPAISGDKPGMLALPPGNEARRRQVRSSDLFGNCREVLIEHAGEFYSLRQTSKGKLILTK